MLEQSCDCATNGCVHPSLRSKEVTENTCNIPNEILIFIFNKCYLEIVQMEKENLTQIAENEDFIKEPLIKKESKA